MATYIMGAFVRRTDPAMLLYFVWWSYNRGISKLSCRIRSARVKLSRISEHALCTKQSVSRKVKVILVETVTNKSGRSRVLIQRS